MQFLIFRFNLSADGRGRGQLQHVVLLRRARPVNNNNNTTTSAAGGGDDVARRRRAHRVGKLGRRGRARRAAVGFLIPPCLPKVDQGQEGEGGLPPELQIGGKIGLKAVPVGFLLPGLQH